MAERSVGATIARGIVRGSRWTGRQVRGEVVRRVGGEARYRVVVMFGLVLALNGADASTVGAISPQLQHAFKIGTGSIGLLSSVSLLVGAVATIPVGLLVDRIKRIPVLSVSIVLWSIASLFSAFAGSYGTLLLTRLLLGVVVATAGPAIASLTGDYFPAQERGKIYAYILGGELAGTAFGFIISSSVASAISWRAAFVLLSIPGFFLARELYRTVPEPLRGGQSHLEPGVEDLVEAAARARAKPSPEEWLGPDEMPTQVEDVAQRAARRLGARPDPELVLKEDPRTMTLADSVRYVMRIPTNVLMIISSSLGYFYFAGLQTFALEFVENHYHASTAEAELVLALLVLGALVGTLFSGWLADVLVHRGMLNSRVWIPGVCYIGAGLLLIPGLLSSHLTPSIWFDVAGASLISAANPPLDAARLDIMPAGLWGRAEGVRTFVRSLGQALGPIIFGELAALIGGIAASSVHQGSVQTNHIEAISPSAVRGLQIAFLILLVTLFAGGVAMLKARNTYATDVATAAASHQGSKEPSVGPSGDTELMRTAGSRTNRERPERRGPRRSTRRRWD
jgi:MFS family permease